MKKKASRKKRSSAKACVVRSMPACACADWTRRNVGVDDLRIRGIRSLKARPKGRKVSMAGEKAKDSGYDESRSRGEPVETIGT